MSDNPNNIIIPQIEADALLSVEKERADSKEYDLENLTLEIPLVSCDRKEKFFLDLRNARIDILKFKYQTRARSVIILARLDFGQAGRHTNPDHVTIEGPHIHIYREGYADKWAYLLDDMPGGNIFSDINDRLKTLNEFMVYCNIKNAPLFARGLFHDTRNPDPD